MTACNILRGALLAAALLHLPSLPASAGEGPAAVRVPAGDQAQAPARSNASLAALLPTAAAPVAEVSAQAPRQPVRSPDARWEPRCPAAGLAVVGVATDGTQRRISRHYLGAEGAAAEVCLVEQDGRVRPMLRQIALQGTDYATHLRERLAGFFPARPGQVLELSSFEPMEQRGPPVMQLFRNRYQYVGLRSVAWRPAQRPVAVLAHDEEGVNHGFAARSVYYFDPESGVLVGFEHQSIRGRPRPVFSWVATQNAEEK